MSRPNITHNVSFQENVPPSRRAGRDVPTPPPKPENMSKTSLTNIASNVSTSAAYPTLEYAPDVGPSAGGGFSAAGADVRRKKSMVRPERERIDPNHRLWHYREHAAEDNVNIQPSCESC